MFYTMLIEMSRAHSFYTDKLYLKMQPRLHDVYSGL